MGLLKDLIRDALLGRMKAAQTKVERMRANWLKRHEHVGTLTGTNQFGKVTEVLVWRRRYKGGPTFPAGKITSRREIARRLRQAGVA